MLDVLSRPPKYENYNDTTYQTEDVKFWFDNLDGPSLLNYGIENKAYDTSVSRWIADEKNDGFYEIKNLLYSNQTDESIDIWILATKLTEDDKQFLKMMETEPKGYF